MIGRERLKSLDRPQRKSAGFSYLTQKRVTIARRKPFVCERKLDSFR